MIAALGAFLALAAGLFDRLRGSDGGVGKGVELGLYGGVVALAVGVDSGLSTFALVTLWAIGATPGWGTPYGSAIRGFLIAKNYSHPEWWQNWGGDSVRRWLVEHYWVSIWLRGNIWALPLTIGSFVWPSFFAAALAIQLAFPAALWLGIKVFDSHEEQWSGSEFIRGVLVVMLTLLFSEAYV